MQGIRLNPKGETMLKKVKVSACELCNGNCLNCYYADECGDWLDNPAIGVPTVEVEATHASMALCEGRHEIPQATDGAVFGNELDPLAIAEIEISAAEKLKGLKTLDLYVTGLTVALVAVLNVCRDNGIKVTLYHFDRNSGAYYTQEVR